MSFRQIEVKITNRQHSSTFDENDLKEICAKSALNTMTNVKNIDICDYGFKTFFDLYQHIVDNPDNLKLIPVEYSEEHSEPFEVMVDAKFYSNVEYWANYNISNLLEQAFEVGVNTLREIGA